ncbi:unnamed protein product [Medioppia subpectinata]|uniref:DUF8206 domain-containing protein n=1 Tax=Medioppia subpectinata TaxID=1979941 RepID=A0A7R9KMC5_9ACAR|nr:unnamed protein product [Medioppia subpectinata]CAG2105159.1 unnamed protein product [Medioppia subpectinata]
MPYHLSNLKKEYNLAEMVSNNPTIIKPSPVTFPLSQYIATNILPTPKPRGFKNVVAMVDSNIITTASIGVDAIRERFYKPDRRISHVTMDKSPPAKKLGAKIPNKPDLGISHLTLENSQLVKRSVTKIIDKPPDVHKTTPNEKKELTILLLGETGVGKSTFINAIVNYMSYESIDAAIDGQPICLIPVSFTMADTKTGEDIMVTFGDQDINENTEDSTKSATRYPKCYKFQNNSIVLNIINTPGIADTDGVDKDEKNLQNIWDFISNYPEINAFCVLLKPNQTRISPAFKYCLLQLFTRLNKSAANNILFLFTNSRSTLYSVGDTSPVLKAILGQIRETHPNVDIPYNRNTIYCFDSESFRYLVASVPPNNIQFDPKYMACYVDSWNVSVDECRRLFEHIMEMPAHKVMDTLSLNNAKQIIQLLTKPLADITKNIADNVKQCEKHKVEINHFTGNIEALRNSLYMNKIQIKSVPLNYTKTVCSDSRCCEHTVVDGVTQTNYKTACHSPCYLHGGDLTRCIAFNRHSTDDRVRTKGFFSEIARSFRDSTHGSDNCLHCGHSYTQHLHITYDTKPEVIRVIDPGVSARISTAQSSAAAKQQLIRVMDQQIAELNAESETIVKSMSMFACFLANNALTPMNDAFEDYVRHLIANERHSTSGADSVVTITRLERVLKIYESEKQLIMSAMSGSAVGFQGSVITAEQIDENVGKLCMLKHKGQDIRTMLDMQRAAKAQIHAAHNTQPTTRFNMATFLLGHKEMD